MEIQYLMRLRRLTHTWLYVPNGDRRFDFEALMRNIERFIPERAKIGAIIVFGSSVREPLYRMESERFLWIFPYSTKIHVNPPKDLDVLVLTESELAKIKPIPAEHLPFHIEQAWPGCYGGVFWQQTLLDGGLHLFITDSSGFTQAMRDEHSLPKNISREGVLVAGRIPQPLLGALGHLPRAKWEKWKCTISGAN